MKKAVPFYPLLAAVFPILAVYSANLSMISPGQLARPIALTLLGTGALWWILALLFRSAEKGASATFVSVLFFFGFSRLAGLSPADRNSPLTLALILVVAGCLAVWAGLRGNWTRQLNVLSVFVLVASLSQIGYGFASSTRATGKKSVTARTVAAGQEPDIYYVILDGYGRSDALRRAIGYSNESFLAELRKRGFYIADQSRANYCQTELSIPSSLNMDYLQRLLPRIKPTEEDRFAVHDLLEHNAVADQLKARGYEYVTVTTGFPLPLTKSDRWIETRSSLNLLETQLLEMTPLAATGDVDESAYLDRRRKILGAFTSLESMAGHGSKPKFVVAHILAPHPPFVFGPNGEERNADKPVVWYDGSDYLRHDSPESYRRGYAEQAEFINKRVLRLVDTLLQGRGPRPIILLQGDHGSKVGLNQNSLAQTDLLECFPNLNAYLVPPSVRSRLRPTITPVNSFRVILSELYGEDLPELPDRSWYSPFQQPYQFTEVTSRIPTHLGR